MGRIDEALRSLEVMDDKTERALQLAALISTLFKIQGVALVVTHQLAYDGYANTSSENPEVELATFSGDLAPRTILEIMRGTLGASGSLFLWNVAGLPVRFQNDAVIAQPELCREFTTDMGVVKLAPVEEIAADCILAAVYPEPDAEANSRAHLLLVNGLADTFQMDWAMLHMLCHRPGYRVGEQLAEMRLAAKKDVDAMGAGRDHIGETGQLPTINARPADAGEPSTPAAEGTTAASPLEAA